MSSDILEISVEGVAVKGTRKDIEFFLNNVSTIASGMKYAKDIMNVKIIQQQQIQQMQIPQQMPQAPAPSMIPGKKEKIVLK